MRKIILFLSALLLLACTESKRLQATSLFEEGKEQEERGAADSAVIAYNKAIKLLELTDEKVLQGEIYNRIGDLYLNNNLENDAFIAFQAALKYNSALQDKSKASYSFRGIGKSYAYRSLPDSALYYDLLAYKLIPLIRDSNEIANIHNNLSNNYSELGDYDSALIYISAAIFFNKDINNIYSHYFAKADIFIAKHQYDSAQIYLKKGALSSNLYTRAGCYLQLFEISKQIGDSNYTKYLEQYHSLNDTIDLLNRGVEIVNAERKYTQSDMIRQKSWLLIWIIGIFVVSVLCIYMILHIHKSKIKKTDKQIQKDELYMQKTHLQINAILANIKETGDICKKKFMKSKEYLIIKENTSSDSNLSYKDQEEYCSWLSISFEPYIQSLLNVIVVSEEDCYLCCLFLIGFNTKQCAIFRNITMSGLRTQKRRILMKIKEIFGSDMTIEFFFNLPEKNQKTF